MESTIDQLKFIKNTLYRSLLGKYSDLLVHLHTKLTPKRATDSGLVEILLEEIRHRQRKNEQKRWELWIRMEKFGIKYGCYDNTCVKCGKKKELHNSSILISNGSCNKFEYFKPLFGEE